MSERQPLQPLTFPLFGSRLIEASAGTGKTWTIAALYVRLVLGHGGEAAFQRPLDPPEILVVTFTEAATRELRERIRRRLVEAAAALSGAPVTDPFLCDLLAETPSELRAGCALRLRLAAEWMDEAAVSTIHAWCRRVLAEHAFDSGSPFELSLETDQTKLRLEAVRDWWRCFMAPLDDALALEVRNWWAAPAELDTALRGLLNRAESVAEAEEPEVALPAVLAERSRRLTELKTPWSGWVGELQTLLDAARVAKAINGTKLKKNNYDDWLNKLAVWAVDEEAIAPDLGRGWERLTPEGLAEVWKTDAPPEHPALAALAALRGEIAALPDARTVVLRHAARWIAERIAAEKRRRAEMGFDDLLLRLANALEGSNGDRLAARIREKFPVALIDEFQDTDPVQYRIFDAVYRISHSSADCALVLIGDPKQAIYAFRGADIHTYLVARHACAGRLYTLNRNFRSTRAVVEAVNHCFAQAEDGPTGAFRFARDGQNPLPFLRAEANGRDERCVFDGRPVPALTAWWLPSDDKGKAAALAVDREAIAAACAGRIRDLLAGSAGFEEADEFVQLKPANIAVLVNNRTEAGIVRRALHERGVRSVYLSGHDSVFATVQAVEIQLWLEACAEPDSSRRVKSALATVTLGQDWTSLVALDEDEQAWDACVLRFRDYREVWRKQGVLPMLRRLMHDYAVSARLLAANDGERVLTDLLHLAELLQQASQTLDGEHALIRYLAAERAEAQENGGNNDAYQLRLESDADLVQVVTVHKSKGLEYPLVFVPFGASARDNERKKPLPIVWHDIGGEPRLSLMEDATARALSNEEQLAEEIRKLYVALTRARHATWLGVAPTRSLERSALGHLLGGNVAPDELPQWLATRWGECAEICIEPAPPGGDQRLRDEGLEVECIARAPQHRSREPWWIASYSAIAADTEASPETLAEEVFREALSEVPAEITQIRPAPGSVHAFPRGAAAGNFLHDLLEWAAREGFAAVAADPARLQEEAERRALARGWGDWAELLVHWLRALMTTPLPLPGGDQCALVEPATLSAELEFWLSAGRVETREIDRLVCASTLDAAPRPQLASKQLSGMLKGFVDLVFEHQGRYYVIDYKSNYLGPDDAAYTPQAMRAAVLEARYELQYVLYLFALHRQLRARLPGYDYDRHIGGAAYVFLRGIGAESRGVHIERPPRELIEALDALFAHEVLA